MANSKQLNRSRNNILIIIYKIGCLLVVYLFPLQFVAKIDNDDGGFSRNSSLNAELNKSRAIIGVYICQSLKNVQFNGQFVGHISQFDGSRYNDIEDGNNTTTQKESINEEKECSGTSVDYCTVCD